MKNTVDRLVLKTLTLPTRPDRGSFRILLKPVLRKDTRRYYAVNTDGMFWTQFREVASDFNSENMAYGVAARIIANNARLRNRISVVPA